MKNNFLIVTTPSVEGLKIEKYYGYVSTNFVVGANWVSDFLATFSDVFGGVSESYTKEIDSLKEMAKANLICKTKLLKMNGIVGFKIDIDPIFGSGYSMFMINAMGTAVKFQDDSTIEPIEKTSETLLFEKVQEELTNLYDKREAPLKTDGLDIFKCEDYELSNYLDSSTGNISLALLKEINDYFALTKNYKVKSIYKKLALIKDYSLEFDITPLLEYLNTDITPSKAFLINNLGFIDYGKILDSLIATKQKSKILTLLYTLNARPNFLDKKQYENLKKLNIYLAEKFNTNVTIKEVGIVKKKKAWICKNCGTVIDMENETCHQCDASKYGLNLKTLDYNIQGDVINLKSRFSHLKSIENCLSTIY